MKKNLIFAALALAILATLTLIYVKESGTTARTSEPVTQVTEAVQQFQPEQEKPPQEVVSIVLTNVVSAPTAVVVTNKVIRPRKVTVVVDPQFGGVKK